MYSLLISLGASLVVGALVLLLGFPFISALLPALITLPVVMFLLVRRTAAMIQAELAALPELLQAAKVDEARALMVQVRDTWSNWQPLLHGQLTGQIGMLSYLQLKFDEAQPLLEAAGGRDWSALVALGCIHFRKGRDEEAWKAFAAAANVGAKESIVYVVWATLLMRRDLRAEALIAVSKGLEALPDHALLRQIKNAIANKQKLDTSTYPDAWMQFFPEEAAQRLMMRGRRGPIEIPAGVNVAQGMGPPPPRGKMARRR
jgi:hypothetical protein